MSPFHKNEVNTLTYRNEKNIVNPPSNCQEGRQTVQKKSGFFSILTWHSLCI